MEKKTLEPLVWDRTCVHWKWIGCLRLIYLIGNLNDNHLTFLVREVSLLTVIYHDYWNQGLPLLLPILSLHYFPTLHFTFSLSLARILFLSPRHILSYSSSSLSLFSFYIKVIYDLNSFAFLLYTCVFSLPIVLRNIPSAESMNSWELATITFGWICHIKTSVISLSIG